MKSRTAAAAVSRVSTESMPSSGESTSTNIPPSGECTKFETHPYKRTALCKNCSKPRQEHEDRKDASPAGKEREARMEKPGKPESSGKTSEHPRPKVDARRPNSADPRISKTAKGERLGPSAKTEKISQGEV